MITAICHRKWTWISAFICTCGMAIGADVWVDLEKIEASDHHQVYRLKGENTSLQEVRHAAGHYWAMGQNGTLYRSADFKRWQRLSTRSNHTLVQLLAAADGTLLVRGSGGNPVDHFFSRDGGNSWHSVTRAQKRADGFANPDWLQTTENLWVENGRFRMATFSPRGILESANGSDWRSIEVQAPGIAAFSNQFRRKLRDVDYLVLLNHDVFSSQDGIAWVAEPVKAFTSSGIWLEEFQKRHIFAVAWNGTNPRSQIHMRTPHSSWSTSEPFGQAALHALVQDNGHLWALTSTDGRRHYTVWKSADAKQWVKVAENLKNLTIRLGSSPMGVLAGGMNGEIHVFPRSETPRRIMAEDRFAQLNQSPAPPARPLSQPEGAIEKGLQLIEAAERGDVKSREALVAALLQGDGFYRNLAQAGFLISRWKLPEERFAYSLALLSEQSNPPDREAARRYFLQAANHANIDAALKFGTYAQRGWGGGVDVNLARHWLQQVVKRGNDAQKAEAQKRLGFMDDLAKTAQGDLEAAVRIGKEYTMEKSDLVDADWAEARKFLRPALAGGNLEAGKIMMIRPESPEDSRDIQLKMAELGDPNAMGIAATNLMNGSFTYPKDPVLAGRYTLQLAAQGSDRAKLMIARVMLGFDENLMKLNMDRDLGKKYLEETAGKKFGEAPMLLSYFNAREARGGKLPVDGEVRGLSEPVFDLLKTWHDGKKAQLTEPDIADLFRAIWRDADYSRAEENLAAEMRAANGKALSLWAADGRQLKFAKAPGIPGALQPAFDKLFPDDWQAGEFTDGDYWINATGSPGFIVCAARIYQNLGFHYQNTLAHQAMNEARKPGWDPLKAHLATWSERIALLGDAEAQEMRGMITRGLNDVRTALQRGGKPDMAGFPEF